MGFLKRFPLFIILIFLLIFTIHIPPIMAEEVAVEVEGIAEIHDGDLLQAKEAAISDALRAAVERVMGTLVDAQTRVENYELLDDSILTRSVGYVTDYEVIEIREDGEYLKVLIRAVVKEDAIIDELDTLKIMVKRAGKPRVMVIVPEEYMKKPATNPAAETAIIQGLLAVGFPVIDPAQLKRSHNLESLRRIVNGDNEELRSLATDYGAEIMVLGEAICERFGYYYGFISCRATLTVRVVRADTGEILVTHSVQMSGAEVTEGNAVKKALANAGEKMAEFLKGAIPVKLSETYRSIQLVITGIDYSTLKLIENHLKETRLVKSVFLRDFSNETARFDIETALTLTQVADEVLRWEEPVLTVTALSGSKIELKKK
ncbi:MAG TPA: hypothetical protein VHY08_04080 [Bacillota bacterium]|nr:hypothetical protein [Bacillota bacterium]